MGATALAPHLAVAAELGVQGLVPTTDRYGAALGDIVRCERCGHMQVDPMPAPQTLAEEYARAASDAYIGEETGQRVTARRALDGSSDTPPGRGGCSTSAAGSGSYSPRLDSGGGRRRASSRACSLPAYARERLGLKVLTAEFELRPARGARIRRGRAGGRDRASPHPG